MHLSNSTGFIGPGPRLLVAGIAALAVAPMACGGGGGDEEITSTDEPTITADVGTVTRRDLVEPLVVRGAVVAMPNQDVKIAALVAGRVDNLSVAEGDWVRPVKSSPRSIRGRCRPETPGRRGGGAGTAAVENARLNFERTERLFQRGIAAGKEVEDARAQRAAADAALEQASAGLETADRQLSRTHVTSPIAGQVVKRLVSVGEQVDGTAAQPIVEVANLDRAIRDFDERLGGGAVDLLADADEPFHHLPGDRGRDVRAREIWRSAVARAACGLLQGRPGRRGLRAGVLDFLARGDPRA